MKKLTLTTSVLATLVLVACGSDNPPSNRGIAIGSPSVAVTVPKAAIDAGTTSSGAIALTGPALCDVKISSIQYNTVGGKGEDTNATTAVMIPAGSAAGCTGARPIVIYAHGTSLDKNNDMANVVSNGEASLVMAMYAAQGFIVVAPNYTGYKGSSLPYHPYLNAQAQSSDVIDALRAAKAALAGLGGTASAKLFITGYSQGGHVAMATHREIQNFYGTEFTVTSSGPMSGPYGLDRFGKQVFSATGPINGGANLFTPLLVDSFQNSYGNIYTKASDVYQAPYDMTAVGLLPNTNLAAAGALPANLFDIGNGSPFLIKTSFRTDVQTNPNNAYAAAGKKNDLIGWKPAAPVGLCWGGLDPVVFGWNSVDSAASIKALGGSVTQFNLEDATTVPSSIKAGFDAQKTALGANLLANYHSPLVPSFCNAIIREFFRNQL
jgi:pimeloyl-ACP methyl ester carboxylesterase